MPDIDEPAEHQAWPFGSPEGDRTELRDPIKEFIDFRGLRFRSGLGLDPRDRKARVIVGRKGAGKTLYLRRLQAAALAENAIYADQWQTSLFRNDCVLRLSHWYRVDSTVVERWEEVWRCAILRSLVSHLLRARELAPDLSPEHERELSRKYRDLYPDYEEPESIYAEVSDIIESARHRDGLDAYLRLRRWASLERLLGEVLKETKPVCFYLDALDEKFEHAPRQWLLCQLGLFKAVMNLLRNARLGSRLHVVIGVRDIVFSSTQMTEHATKFVETHAIRTLDWDRPAIDYFLERKLERLDASHLMEPDAENSMERWLGRRRIYNEARDQEEDIKDYLLRHTRLIPRDVVVLGNMMCELIDDAQHEGQPFLTELEIRQIVGLAARRFGQEELCVVANHLTAEAMPPDAAEQGYADFYTADKDETRAYPQLIAERVAEVLGVLEFDRFEADRLLAFAELAAELIDTRAETVDVMWQHGLLGYIEGPSILDGRVVFYSAAREDRLRLPRNKPGYALHAIMVDTIDELRGVGQPVHPY
jgi:hypothetical protein